MADTNNILMGRMRGFSPKGLATWTGQSANTELHILEFSVAVKFKSSVGAAGGLNLQRAASEMYQEASITVAPMAAAAANTLANALLAMKAPPPLALVTIASADAMIPTEHLGTWNMGEPSTPQTDGTFVTAKWTLTRDYTGSAYAALTAPA